jgi:hypothetical protein
MWIDDKITRTCFSDFQAKLREVASLEGHVLLKKLRDALESLRGRMAGRNKEDVEKAISMVSLFPHFFHFLFCIKAIDRQTVIYMFQVVTCG